jgi:hypothetical protein
MTEATTEPTTLERLARQALGLLVLLGALLAFSAAVGVGTAAADHCDPNSDPNCRPHPPVAPPVTPEPPCNGDVGPVHAWPCAGRATMTCVDGVDGSTECPAAHLVLYPVSAFGVSTPGYDSGWYRVDSNAPGLAVETLGWAKCSADPQKMMCYAPEPLTTPYTGG